MAKTYDDSSIRVLKELEPIQKNPGMFIGDTEKSTHLLTEAFDNAQDEAKAGYANLVAVMIDTAKKEYTIIDNGRGIPFQNNTIITVATELFSGGKFDKGEEESYDIATGLHGVGIVAITALSEYLTIDVIRDKTHASCRWEKGKLVTDNTEIEAFSGDRPFSTKITFKPDKQYFGSIDIDLDYIRKRMKLASVHIPKLKLALIIDNKKEVITCDMNEFFKGEITKDDKPTALTTTKDIRIPADHNEELHIRWCYSLEGSPTPRHHGSVNILSVDQGHHIDETNRIFREVLFEFAKKKKMSIARQDCLVGFRALTNIMLLKTSFEGQNKARFNKRKPDMNYLYDKLKIQLQIMLTKEDDLLATLLLHFENYRKKLDSTKNIVKTGDSVSRSSSTLGGKLRDCITHSVTKSELFIVEGDSAAGTLIAARDPNIHAVLPLKGKSIPNVAGLKDPAEAIKKKGKGRTAKKDLKKSEKKTELVEMINACGTGMEPDFNMKGIRYGKIIIGTDADADGAHIASIIMTAFLKLMPEIIRQGHLYICLMPLYGVRAKKFIPFYNDEEMETYKKSHPKEHILRFKGLGEMNDSQLAMCMLDQKSRRIVQVQFPEDPQVMFRLMTDAAMKRAIL